MKSVFLILFIALLSTACAPQATVTSTSTPETDTSEVSPTGTMSETSEVLTETSQPSQTTITTEAVTDAPTNTLAIDTTASISAALVGTKVQYVVNFTSPNHLSCSIYDVSNHPGFYTTDPQTCLPDVPLNNRQWGTIENIALQLGTPVPFLDYLKHATGVANPNGFGITPNQDYQGLQYFTLKLGNNDLIIWLNATAPQVIITNPNNGGSGQGGEDGGEGGGGGNCTPPAVWDPDLQSCVDGGTP